MIIGSTERRLGNAHTYIQEAREHGISSSIGGDDGCCSVGINVAMFSSEEMCTRLGTTMVALAIIFMNVLMIYDGHPKEACREGTCLPAATALTLCLSIIRILSSSSSSFQLIPGW